MAVDVHRQLGIAVPRQFLADLNRCSTLDQKRDVAVAQAVEVVRVRKLNAGRLKVQPDCLGSAITSEHEYAPPSGFPGKPRLEHFGQLRPYRLDCDLAVLSVLGQACYR